LILILFRINEIQRDLSFWRYGRIFSASGIGVASFSILHRFGEMKEINVLKLKRKRD